MLEGRWYDKSETRTMSQREQSYKKLKQLSDWDQDSFRKSTHRFRNIFFPERIKSRDILSTQRDKYHIVLIRRDELITWDKLHFSAPVRIMIQSQLLLDFSLLSLLGDFGTKALADFNPKYFPAKGGRHITTSRSGVRLYFSIPDFTGLQWSQRCHFQAKYQHLAKSQDILTSHKVLFSIDTLM